MAIQHHFVVVIEDGVATIDHETTSHKFYEGAVWNPDSDNWEDHYDHASDYEAAMEQLTNLLIPTWREN
jgi:hypothetical protein